MELSVSDITILFVCKVCQDSVNTIDKFVRHKELKHSTDFRNLTCIVFEEKSVNDISSNLLESYQPDQLIISDVGSVPVKQEFIEVEDESKYEITLHEFNHSEANSSLSLPKSTEEMKSEFENGTLCPTSSLTDFQPCPQQAPTFECLTNAAFNGSFDIHHKNLEISLLQPKTVQSRKSFISEESDNSPVLDFKNHAEDHLSSSSKSNFLLKPFVRIQKLTAKELQNTSSCSQVIASTCKTDPLKDNDILVIDLEDEDETEPTTATKNPNYNLHIPQTVSNHAQRVHQCPLCNKIFDSAARLNIHEGICQLYNNKITSLLTGKNQCDECHNQFKTINGLKNHKWSVHKSRGMVTANTKSLKCPHPGCSKTFENKRFLSCHKAKQHTLPSERQYKCNETNCGRTYKSELTLQDHIIRKHREGHNLPVFTCDICFKTFSVIRLLQSHSLVHTKEKPFKCQVQGCNVAFKRKQDLDRHGMRHQ